MKTTKEIAEYVGRTFKYGGDARSSGRNARITHRQRSQQTLQTEATRGEIRLWEKAH
jgi:hypothetical protein